MITQSISRLVCEYLCLIIKTKFYLVEGTVYIFFLYKFVIYLWFLDWTLKLNFMVHQVAIWSTANPSLNVHLGSYTRN